MSHLPDGHVTGPLVERDLIPGWLHALTDDVDALTDIVNRRGGDRAKLARMVKAARNRRAAAVLILFAGGFDADPAAPGGLPDDVDVLLLERATTLRQHSGQVAFPGGGHDDGEPYPVHTALREAQEETGLDPAGVRVLANLPSFSTLPSPFEVVPVLGYWETPSPVRAVDAGETARVARIRMADLLDPANRFQVRRDFLGGKVYQGPAFMVDGLLVWGFTGGLLAAISAASGWDVPWDHDDVRPLDDAIAAAKSSQEHGLPLDLPFPPDSDDFPAQARPDDFHTNDSEA
ncbi:MAG: CoA pyrophosphatase [Gordonia sp. (in: high G+C Gram-positive bacteria)]|uniref:NUDIX hydrolase n=1 Tax=Gordonia sp. (in: high G+C Gram-positive bacteria) TaxID=84139 RepID=UPI0039E5B707